MQHRIAFTTVQAEPGKPVLPAQQVNDGQKGALREEYSVWGLETGCILRRLWQQQREIHQWGKALQTVQAATAFVSALLLCCVAQITFVIVTVMRIEFSLQHVQWGVCVCVCNLPVATPNTSHMWHTICSSFSYSGHHLKCPFWGYRIQLIIFNWIRYPRLEIMPKGHRDNLCI